MQNCLLQNYRECIRTGFPKGGISAQGEVALRGIFVLGIRNWELGIWNLEAEKNYYTHHQAYYNNLRRLGLEYDTLDYGQALPFLLMLPSCIVPQQ